MQTDDLTKEFNIIVGNIYAWRNADLVEHLFSKEKIHYMTNETDDIYDILVRFNIFKSKSEARKNWNRTGKSIPLGYNEFRNIGKQKKSLFIWNPVEIKEEDLID